MLERGVLVICALAAHPVSKRTEIHQQEFLNRFLFIGTPSLKFHKSLAREISFSRSLLPVSLAELRYGQLPLPLRIVNNVLRAGFRFFD